ncbi:hypothetical protein [Pseudomonas syringae]|uniref:hypothetical protein n=1 Tax=Pseudomonas syringae TaxID=317 RepID=UPI00177DFEA0|nr:hypothetical protein [Pseudomonas syringae]
MISMELSGVQRNTETSAQHAAAIEGFLAQGAIQVLEAFVQTSKLPAAAYGRNFRTQKHSKFQQLKKSYI